MINPFLVGDKVYLRSLEPSDAAAMVGWINDADVRRTIGTHRPANEQSERDFIERATRSADEIGFAIIARKDDRFVGTAGLMRIDWRARHACFGISIGDRTRWNLGYGTDVTRLVTGYGFDTLNLHRVWLQVFDINPAGIKVYERVGYRHEGAFREAVFRDGRYCDVINMAVLRSEWTARYGEPRPRESAGGRGAARPGAGSRPRAANAGRATATRAAKARAR